MSHASLRPAATATRQARIGVAPTPARIGTALIWAAAVLTGWACWLGVTLPVSALVQTWSTPLTGLGNWRLTWVGLDALEVAGLLATGIALRRRHWSATVSALVTLPLFVLDAWFDVMTTATSSELRQALVMALLVELPTASVLAWVGRSGIRTLRHAADAARPPAKSLDDSRTRADATH